VAGGVIAIIGVVIIGLGQHAVNVRSGKMMMKKNGLSDEETGD